MAEKYHVCEVAGSRQVVKSHGVPRLFGPPRSLDPKRLLGEGVKGTVITRGLLDDTPPPPRLDNFLQIVRRVGMV